MLKKIAKAFWGILKTVFWAVVAWVRALSREMRKAPYRAHVWSWLKFFGIFTAIILVVLLGIFGYFAFSLPSLERLERLESGLITRVSGKDGTMVHEFYIQRRIWMAEKDMPERLKQAVIAIEDRSFREHWGVDLTAYPSALLPAVFGDRARGASTLTQQLAKNLILTPERTIGRKVREILLAVEIERRYTKKEILEFYFNHVYLGSGAYGFASASERYFSKPLDSLNVGQYALLAGLLQRPEYYRPDNYAEVALMRRNVVLGAMRRAGFLTRAEWRAAVKAPLGVRTYRPPSNLGPYFIEHTRQFLTKRWGDDFVYNQGGSVEVTMDSALQHQADSLLRFRLAEIQQRLMVRTAKAYDMPRFLKVPLPEILKEWDPYYAKFQNEYLKPDDAQGSKRFPLKYRYHRAQAALMVIENSTGAVRALVGGEDYEAVRSPGSSFKPFVYATAIAHGASPGTIVHDQPIAIPEASDPSKVWRPRNYEPEFEGRMTMRRAFYKSKNLPAVEVGLKYGLGNIVATARRFGLTHNVPAVPSLALGSADVTLMEMVSAYTVFPNGGSRAEPYYVERVRDKNGRTLYRHEARRSEALSPDAAWIMTTMMKDVNIRGTGAAIWASGFRHPSGGKTGTTNDFSDAWYVGYTKAFTAGIWVGIDDHSSMGPGHTGSADGVPLWIDVMNFAMRNRPLQDFPRPEGVVSVALCPLSGLRAQGFCPTPILDYAVSGKEPAFCSGQHSGSAPSAPSVNPSGAPSGDRGIPPSGPGREREDPRMRKTF
jgi:penicillin-binding protein 1A